MNISDKQWNAIYLSVDDLTGYNFDFLMGKNELLEMRQLMKLIFFILLSSQVVSCGQKGALYIPNDQAVPDVKSGDQMSQNKPEPPTDNLENNSSY